MAHHHKPSSNGRGPLLAGIVAHPTSNGVIGVDNTRLYVAALPAQLDRERPLMPLNGVSLQGGSTLVSAFEVGGARPSRLGHVSLVCIECCCCCCCWHCFAHPYVCSIRTTECYVCLDCCCSSPKAAATMPNPTSRTTTKRERQDNRNASI
jgi:hypothetical protein